MIRCQLALNKSLNQEEYFCFPGAWDDSIAGYQTQFINQVTDNIVRIAHVSHIRVQKATFSYDSSNVYFVATLLDLPPAIGISYMKRI